MRTGLRPALVGMAIYAAAMVSAGMYHADAQAVSKAGAVDRGAVVGTTPVTLIPDDPNRRGYSIQVQSASASCYVNDIAPVSTDFHSTLLPPGSLYEPESARFTRRAVTIVCTAAGTQVAARSW